MNSANVLILVLVDFTLRPLNSARNTLIPVGVLILVLVDFTLRRRLKSTETTTSGVLILVLVDFTLRPRLALLVTNLGNTS